MVDQPPEPPQLSLLQFPTDYPHQGGRTAIGRVSSARARHHAEARAQAGRGPRHRAPQRKWQFSRDFLHDRRRKQRTSRRFGQRFEGHRRRPHYSLIGAALAARSRGPSHRRQKAWFLPAAPMQGACGASGSRGAGVHLHRPAGLGAPAGRPVCHRFVTGDLASMASFLGSRIPRTCPSLWTKSPSAIRAHLLSTMYLWTLETGNSSSCWALAAAAKARC